MVELVRHRQTKESATDRLHLNHRATPRLHPRGFRSKPHFSGNATYRALASSSCYGQSVADRSILKTPNSNSAIYESCHARFSATSHFWRSHALTPAGSNPQVPQSTAKPLKIVLWILFAVWIVSFFLPTYVDVRPGFGGGPTIVGGVEAALGSILAIVKPIYGWAWTANIFMLIAPFRANSAHQGKARIFAVLFYAAALIGWCCAFPPFRFSLAEVGVLTTGYFVWELSILCAATLFLAAAFRHWLVAIASCLLACSLVHAPEYMLRLRYDRIVQNANMIVQRVESGGPGVFSAYEAFGGDWNIRVQPRYFEISSAMMFLREIEVCKQRERISDEIIVRDYQREMIRPPDPNHIPQPPAPNGPEEYCKLDESPTKPWISQADLERYALSEAKAHLRNPQ